MPAEQEAAAGCGGYSPGLAASGPTALLCTHPAGSAELFAQSVAHEALQAHVMPHAELLEVAGDAARNPRRKLDKLLVGRRVKGFHAF